MEGTNMTISEFAERAAQGVRECLGEGYGTEVKEVTKNNGCRLTALMIHGSQPNIAPVIYLEGYYQHYKDGMALEAVCRDIAHVYQKEAKEKKVDLSFARDFRNVEDKVYCRLINAEKNREMLDATPHMPYLDLAAVAYVPVFDMGDGEEGTICVTDGLMQVWGIDIRTLFSCAKRNTRGRGEKVMSMAQVLAEMMGGETVPDGIPGMSVATNDTRSFGAAVMMDEEFLRDFADRVGGSFFILPSSVHELLFLPSEGVRANDLKDMVREVNRTQVAPEEVLSDSVYYYNKEVSRVEIA